jgi:hypothetical protein
LGAIEVKGGRSGRLPGIQTFLESHPNEYALVIASGGIPLEEFFERNPSELLSLG